MTISDRCFVYIIKNLVNSTYYVGVACDVKIRWRKHIGVAYGSTEKMIAQQCAIHKAILKYGKENFSFKIIEDCATRENALQKEIFWIKYLSDLKISKYNETTGGDGFGKHSLERKKKISERHSGEKCSMSKMTEEKVKEIRFLYQNYNIKQSKLCIIYKLSPSAMSAIIHHHTWNFGLEKPNKKIIPKRIDDNTKDIIINMYVNDGKGPKEISREVCKKFDLSESFITQLIRKHKKTNGIAVRTVPHGTIPLELKKQVFLAKQETGLSDRKISDKFKISRPTVSKIIREFNH